MSESYPLPPPPAPQPRRLGKALLGLAVLTTLGFASLGPRFPRGQSADAGQPRVVSGEGVQVEVASPRRGPIVTVVEAPGSVRAGSEVGIGAPFEGQVIALDKDTGDAVREHDVLFRLDPRDREEAVATAKLDLARNEAALGEAKAERSAAERRVAELQGEPSELVEARLMARQKALTLERTRAQLQVAALNLEQQQGMLKQGVGRKLDVESAASEQRQAEIGVRLAQEDLHLAQETLAFRQTTWQRDQRTAAKDLEVARAREARAEADLRATRLTLEQRERDLERTQIRSPIDGVVTGRGVNMGDLVVRLTGSETHYIVSDLRHLLVYCDVDEGDVIHVARGQQAQVQVNALGYGRLLRGAVYDVGYRAQTASGEQVSTFTVRILLAPDQEGLEQLRPGMNASATIETDRREDVLKVPLQALVQRERKELPQGTTLPPELSAKGPTDLIDCVFVVEGGKARLRVVRRGLQDDDEAEVLSELAPDAVVVVGPYRALEKLTHEAAVGTTPAKDLLPPDAAPGPTPGTAPVSSGD